MALTFRGTKGTPLTHDELDNNFREFFYSASVNNNTVSLFKPTALEAPINLPFPSASGQDTWIQIKSGNNESGSNEFLTSSPNLRFDYSSSILHVTGTYEHLGNINVNGTVRAQQFITTTVSSSISYVSGSNKLGDTADDIQTIIGQINHTGNTAQTGNLNLTGDVDAEGSITGSDVKIDAWGGVSSSLAANYKYSVDTSASLAETITFNSASIASDLTSTSASLATTITFNSASIASDLTELSSSLLVTISDTSASLASTITNNSASIASTVTNLSSSVSDTYLLNTTDSLAGDLTITNNLTVLGTGSFSYIQSVTGSAKVIGDAYIILNTDSPAERYAGIKVYDSGSTDTGSLEYDSVNNHWFYESTNEGYASGLIAGPRDSRGSITFPSNNTLVKGLGGNHIGNSIISDNGSSATISGDLTVTGIITGTLTGSIENAQTASYIDYSKIDNAPTNVSSFTNDSNYITAASIPTNVSAFTNDAGYTTYSSNQATNTTSNVTFNTVNATGDITAFASSDERLKDNIQTIPNAVEKVQQIKGVSFDWNGNQTNHSGHDIGVIAQDIEKVLPEIVATRDDGYKAVRYEKIVALLIEAVKEQQLQIDELKSKL